MKDILLLVHDDAGQEARFQVALDLVRAVEGHLRCIDIAVPAIGSADCMAPGIGAALMLEEVDREARNQRVIEGRLAHEDVPWSCIDARGDPVAALRSAARLCDVIVVDSQLDKFPHPELSDVAGELIVTSGKPVLAVPSDARRFDAFGRVVIAWDGSREAEVAMRCAVPLLGHAGGVVLLEIDDGSVNLPAEAAATYLSRHGIRACVRRKQAKGRAGDAILREIGELSPDYVVMGGFSRPRFVEQMFGGVTVQMFRQCPVPLLIAH